MTAKIFSFREAQINKFAEEFTRKYKLQGKSSAGRYLETEVPKDMVPEVTIKIREKLNVKSS